MQTCLQCWTETPGCFRTLAFFIFLFFIHLGVPLSLCTHVCSKCVHAAGDGAQCGSLWFVEDIPTLSPLKIRISSFPHSPPSHHFPILSISPHFASITTISRISCFVYSFYISWIFCATHSGISIPAATDLCALLLTRFPCSCSSDELKNLTL